MGASGVLPKDGAPLSLVRWLRYVMSGQLLVPLAVRNAQRSRMRGKPEELVIALTGRERQINGIGVNRAFKSGSWEAAPHFRKNHQGPPASYLPEALDPQPDCACQYRPYVSAVPATAEQVMA